MQTDAITECDRLITHGDHAERGAIAVTGGMVEDGTALRLAEGALAG